MFTEILTAASREPVVNIEVQAHWTESKGNISTKMVEITSKSVGLIIGYLTSGTGFRVGEKYIMTSLHIVKGICSRYHLFRYTPPSHCHCDCMVVGYTTTYAISAIHH